MPEWAILDAQLLVNNPPFVASPFELMMSADTGGSSLSIDPALILDVPGGSPSGR
jgi:hypothetical protein